MQRSLLIGVVLLASCASRTDAPLIDRGGAAPAQQALGACSRDSALPMFVERLRRQYVPTQSASWNELIGIGPAYLFTPDVVPVTAGQSGNHAFTVTWYIGPRSGDGPPETSKPEGSDAPTPFYGVCLYRGTGALPRSTTCTGNGTEYRLLFCTTVDAFTANGCAADPDGCANNPVVLGATSVPHGGLLEGVTYLLVHGFEGDSCATTEATLTLLAPPDSNGDGIPECLNGDTAAPAWPTGSRLSATRSSASSATVTWTAATDNVGVTGYRLYVDGQLVRELGAQTLTATVAGLASDIAHAFSVEAFDAAGNVSSGGPTATILLDTQPPTWPAGSTLAATRTAPTAAALAWTEALDGVGVAGYRVYRDGQRILEVPATTLTATVGSLPTDVVLTFRVQAFDANGNESTGGPQTTILLDATPPSWPSGSTLAVTSTGQGTALLAWTAAIDNVAVTGYRVLRDGQLIASVDGETRVANVTRLVAETTYTFTAQAVDAAGNVSNDGPQATLRLDGLAPTWPPGSILVATPIAPDTAILVWTGAIDNIAVAGYRILHDGAPIRDVDAGTLSTTVTGLTHGGTLRVEAFDAAGNVSSGGPQTIFAPDLTPPWWPAGAALTIRATGPRSVSLSWPTAIDDRGVAEYRISQGAIVVRTASPDQLAVEITALDPETEYTFRIDALDPAGNIGVGPIATYRIGTIDPTLVAPPLEPNASTTVHDLTAFLYTGPDAVQTGVAPTTIRRERAALIRGRTVEASGAPVRDVVVAVLAHPEYGQTRTRIDGRFDLVVNGGGPIVVTYNHPNYLGVQRQIEPAWDATSTVDDVVLIAPSATVTEILGDAPFPQIARGDHEEDEDGSRQVTMLFRAGTVASAVHADGTEEPLESLSVRATEYTVGSTGRRAMPGDLPPASAYTYAVELSVDEAVASGAVTVKFTQPVVAYLENFIDLPVGETVPAGTYDRRAGRWIADRSGRVIKIVAETNGLAELDVDGDGAIDPSSELASLGIDDGERVQIAALYAPGQSLWRVPLEHFSPHDFNLGWGPDGAGSGPKSPPVARGPLMCPSTRQGSVIECENQILGEYIPVTGTGFSLAYTSGRAAGRSVERTIEIPLTGATIPNQLQEVRVSVDVAGQHHDLPPVPPVPNQTTTFTWDGKDAYGRPLRGAVDATVNVSYMYPIVYRRTPDFGVYSVAPYFRNDITRVGNVVAVSQGTKVRLEHLPLTPASGLGGWSLSSHHELDPKSGILYRGDGGREQKGRARLDLVAPTQRDVHGLAFAPDGTLYFVTAGVVMRRSPSGTVTRFAGLQGQAGFSGDGGPAAAARLRNPQELAMSRDGTLYVLDAGNFRIRAIDGSGIIRTVAGNGVNATAGDNGPATSASLRDPNAIALGPDGDLYVTEIFRIRRIGTDGTIRTIAGSSCPNVFCNTGDGGPAVNALLTTGGGLAVGPDGSIYVGNAFTDVVRRITPDGIIRRFAGNATNGITGDGGPALAAQVSPTTLTVGPDGAVYLGETSPFAPVFSVVRRIGVDGVIQTVAGQIGRECFARGAPTGVLPTSVAMCLPVSLAVSPTGALAVGEATSEQLYWIQTQGLELDRPARRVATGDGTAVHDFDRNGTMLQSHDPVTGAVVATFGYDDERRLTSIVDAFGNVVAIERLASDRATIIGPYGHRTELFFDADGYLERVVDPLGEAIGMTYAAGGLLQSFADPLRGTSTFTYDGAGRLLTDVSPGGGEQRLARSAVAGGYRIERTTSLGRNTSYEVAVDALGRMTRRIGDEAGHTTTISVEPTGRSTTTLPDGSSRETTTTTDGQLGSDVDALARATARLPSGRTFVTEWSKAFTLSTPGDPLSVRTLDLTSRVNGSRTARSSYDAATKTTTLTTAGGRVIRVVYGASGQPIRLEQPGRFATTFEHDERGRLKASQQGDRRVTLTYGTDGFTESITGPGTRVMFLGHDSVGRVRSATRPDGEVLRFDFEDHGRRRLLFPPGRLAHVEAIEPEARREIYAPPALAGASGVRETEVDVDGEVRQLTFGEQAAAQTVTVVRDAAGRPLQQITPRGTFTYTYDAVGRTEQMSTPEGDTLTFAYDGPLITAVSQGGAVPGIVTYALDIDSRLDVETANGSAISYDHDADDLLVRAGDLQVTRGAATGIVGSMTLEGLSWTFLRNGYGELDRLHVQDGRATLFLSEVLSRDDVGRVRSRREQVGIEVRTVEYGYDDQGRLTDVMVDGTPAAHHEYDANGNRTLVERGTETQVATYDAQDRLLSQGPYLYSYSADGALESKTDVRTNAVTTYDYDLHGNLLAVLLPNGVVVEYVVDAQGRRIGRKVNGAFTHRWLYGLGPAPVAELDAAGVVVARFVYATRAWVPDYVVRESETYALILDDIGSVRAVVNATSGAVVELREHDDWGRTVAPPSIAIAPFGFAGGLIDPLTGLVRLGRRDYDPEVGRWTTKDSLLFHGGDTNLYAYAVNDPVDVIDPQGQQVVEGALLACTTYPELCIAAIAAVGVAAVAAGQAAAATAECFTNGPCGDAVRDAIGRLNPFKGAEEKLLAGTIATALACEVLARPKPIEATLKRRCGPCAYVGAGASGPITADPGGPTKKPCTCFCSHIMKAIRVDAVNGTCPAYVDYATRQPL